MNRYLIFGEININDQLIIIGNSHLETFKENYDVRVKQLNDVIEAFKTYENAFFLGCQNITTQDELKQVDLEKNGYIDLWKITKPN